MDEPSTAPEYVSAANLELARARAPAAVIRNLRLIGLPEASCFMTQGVTKFRISKEW